MEYLKDYANDLLWFLKSQLPEISDDTLVCHPSEGGNSASCIITGTLDGKEFTITLCRNTICFEAKFEEKEEIFAKILNLVTWFIGNEYCDHYGYISREENKETFTVVLEHRLDLGVVKRTV